MAETMTAPPAAGDDDGSEEGVTVAEGAPKRRRHVRAGAGEIDEYLGLRVTKAEMAEIERLMELAPDCTKSTVVRALLRIGMRVVRGNSRELGAAMIVKPGR
jgi:hypothetical protein